MKPSLIVKITSWQQKEEDKIIILLQRQTHQGNVQTLCIHVFYKEHLYKEPEAEICQKNKNH